MGAIFVYFGGIGGNLEYVYLYPLAYYRNVFG